ncbi:MAG: S-adenosyl-l-methionine hydroxide adenosyltransferase family protein [Candidatus Methanoperedens sp.]|nr:S-adenosyl-l-methionine hydroxide adenosyltransferase family protein [Candidatus Methanoperedens sp.]MCZ7370079.1 S-adenosyl-l-methionine hydroxide adenosyltransferase family protein [Candidatus Methanoperedens sp.]
MVITLLSDFGDVYPASMKGVILSINPAASIVDISHSIPRYDIRAGAFILMSCARFFPSGTVHIAVVDPGVGTERRQIAVKAESDYFGTHYFTGPDNGLLIPAARSIGDFEAYIITNEKLFRKNVSGTFHGRDIFAPVGAHISKGLDIRASGEQIFDYIDLEFGQGRKKKGALEGMIIFIDSFGNIVTNISSDIVEFKYGDLLEIQGRKVPFLSSYGFSGTGEPLALIGSHGFLEIAVNMGNAAAFFNKTLGDEILIKI